MDKIYGVVFNNGGKIYNFNSNNIEVALKDNVIVETEKGIQFGKIVSVVNDESIEITTLKPVLRKATTEDYDIYMDNLKEAKKALNKAREVAEELDLDMNIIDANYTFDRKQLLFNFLADERIDFRNLAKKLAFIYKTRIELRQIGVRDKAREIGGIGICGMKLCCNNFLNHLDSVSMGMAKNQNISLNPNKINGNCGRLLCCLAYEDNEYTECRKGLPNVGDEILLDNEKGKVKSVDILNKKCKIEMESGIKEKNF